ncbi:MAG TPA: 1,4-beta-xylanase [Ruminiclostridium sp.]|nr:1,4-beta-xylanase [Clostridiaceae bacterium]HAA24842.1 1,4-beta-xylanase [Ruminiclostridium sp.]
MENVGNRQYGHRMSVKKITFIRSDGQPLKNTKVSVKQTKHGFLFGGVGFYAIPLANNELEGKQKELFEKVIEKFLDIFNYSTLPFYWGRFEPLKGQPDTKRVRKGAEWLISRGCKLKGHPLCWHTVTAPWLLEMSNVDIFTSQINRIRREVSDFAGIIDIWDVINEVVIMPIFDKYDNGITRICKEMGRIRLVREVFHAAKKANPDAILLINDFDVSESYDILVEGCLEAGIPIDVIGIQSHMHKGYWGVEKTLEVIERFSRFKLPIHFTENNILSGHLMPREYVDLNDYVVDDWPTTPDGEERQARELVTHYKTLFAHPAVESITYWDFMDGQWLRAPSGFLRKDGSEKPAYQEIRKLIKEEWWTKPKEYVTDESGAINVTGFVGEYDAECMGKTAAFTLEKMNPDNSFIYI